MLPLLLISGSSFAIGHIGQQLTEIVDSEKGVLELTDIFIEKIATLRVHASIAFVTLRVVESIDIESRGGDPAIGRSSL